MSDRKELFETQIKIRYRKLPLSGKVLWPIIDIELPSLPQSIFALIDSGASHSILHEDIADILGLTRSKNELKVGSSASGNYKYWVSKPIDVGIYSHQFSFKFTVIVNNRNLIWPCILGHDSIFKVAKLEFRTFKGDFKIFFRTDIN